MGHRHCADGSSIADGIDSQTDNKGYTGHEMLDQLDLVHMNGRIYDPLVARMMSADPFIQDPEHSQSYNRYTYVWNNPTNLTDPTGFMANDETGYSAERSTRGDRDSDVPSEQKRMPVEQRERPSSVNSGADQSGISKAAASVVISGSLAQAKVEQFLFDLWLKESARGTLAIRALRTASPALARQ